MASPALQQLLAWLHSLASHLASRLEHLMALLRQNQASAGVAAVAALAISVFFAWRFSRGLPRGRQPRRKEDDPRTAAPGRGTSHPAGDAGASSSSSSRGAAGLQRPGSAPLEASSGPGSAAPGPAASAPASALAPIAAAVRKHLGGAQRVTCHVLGVLLRQETPEELQEEGASVLPSAREVLLEVARQADLYLMAKVEDDASEVAILSALEDAGITAPGSPFNSRKLLFCSTDTGIMSFVRQLEPDLHMESSSLIVDQLKRFVKRELHVASGLKDLNAVVAPNIVSTTSLENFFGTVHLQ